MSFNAGLDHFEGSFQTLSKNRDSAFAHLRLALTKPRFDAVPVERIALPRLRSKPATERYAGPVRPIKGTFG